MKIEKFLNEMEDESLSFLESDDLASTKRSVQSTGKDSKLKNSVKVFQTLDDSFDRQTARKIVTAWKESKFENFKDFLYDLINNIKNS